MIEALQHAAASAPGDFAAHGNLGFALAQAGKIADAAQSYARVLALRPEFEPSYALFANALVDSAGYRDALRWARRARRAMPRSTEAHHALGYALHALGRDEAAIESFEAALQCGGHDRHVRMSLAFSQLRIGRYREGWHNLEARGGIGFDRPEWRGNPSIEGRRLLITHERGYGDTIQFIRYAPILVQRGARVIVLVPPGLKSLFQELSGVEQIIAEGEKLPDFDFHCPVMSLPLALNLASPAALTTKPYLTADASRIAYWRTRLESKSRPRIGIIVSGNPRHRHDSFRSIPLALAARHLHPIDADFHLVQSEIREADKPHLGAIRSHEGALADFAETAALLANLDLVIGVDTAVTHLAGAIGRPVWILLPFWSDWRWGVHGDATHWYPAARLFRQAEDRNWAPVLETLATALRHHLR